MLDLQRVCRCEVVGSVNSDDDQAIFDQFGPRTADILSATLEELARLYPRADPSWVVSDAIASLITDHHACLVFYPSHCSIANLRADLTIFSMRPQPLTPFTAGLMATYLGLHRFSNRPWDNTRPKDWVIHQLFMAQLLVKLNCKLPLSA